MQKIAIASVATLLLLGASGCGKSEQEKASEAAGQSGRGTITCDGSATSASTGLPAGFPQPDAVTYVTATKSGPTNVVDGFSTESLKGMYNEYKDRFEEAGYDVTFDELEEDNGDSEVAYKTKDGTEGIVALRGGDACDNGNVSVHITNRPSD
jgi:energy-coupling factor transporter ATP-binding protein EcfA2